ncbi:MAG: hypothetical protein QXQ29_05220 [Candidatus Bathyarchaeia archaeon]
MEASQESKRIPRCGSTAQASVEILDRWPWRLGRFKLTIRVR